jgi:hypothetical protein
VGMACKQIMDGGLDSFTEFVEPAPGFDLSLLWRNSLMGALGVSGHTYNGILYPPVTGLAFAIIIDLSLT